ncbi:MAG: replication initiator protein [Microviridae sp.]|nr:MAG: replication initiator protein [Microviridae sp.]
MCLFPKLINNPKYRANKKNGGVIPPVLDERVTMVPIGCGKCIECMKKRAREWQVRLTEDIKEHKNGTFLTLTFSLESLKELYKEVNEKARRLDRNAEIVGYDLDNAVCTLAVRRFLKRWQKETKKSVRHWLVTEIGGKNTEHVHLHGIIYSKNVEMIKRKWGYGYVWAGYEGKETYVNETTIAYVVKYMTKTDEKHPNYKAIILTSPGIGNKYTERHDYKNNAYKPGETKEYYRNAKGTKLALPIYYRNKRYTEEEREKLWIEKLDKGERYVLGNKVDVKQGEEKYIRAVEEARKTNKELGYGGEEEEWDKVEYEKQLRRLKQMERIEKNKKKK